MTPTILSSWDNRLARNNLKACVYYSSYEYPSLFSCDIEDSRYVLEVGGNDLCHVESIQL